MNMILFIIQEYGKMLSKNIMIKVISFGNSLLKGGNKIIQQTIFDYFLNNSESELIF